MQSITKIALASLALLGTVAVVAPAADAQGYGYYGYGYGAIGSNGPTPGYCGPHTSQMTNWILDPATGQPITQAQYLARYPSNPATWSYSCNTGLWTDPGYVAPVYQGPAYYQAPEYYRGPGYSRESRNVDRNRGHEQNRGSEQNRGHGDRNQANDQHRDRGQEGDRH